MAGCRGVSDLGSAALNAAARMERALGTVVAFAPRASTAAGGYRAPSLSPLRADGRGGGGGAGGRRGSGVVLSPVKVASQVGRARHGSRSFARQEQQARAQGSDLVQLLQHSEQRQGLHSRQRARDRALQVARAARDAKPRPRTVSSGQARPTAFGSTAKRSGYIEDEQKRVKDLPAPGQYNIAANGADHVTGGRMGQGTAKSELDWAVYRAAQTPGPDAYNLRSGGLGPGGRFNLSKSKGFVEWEQHRAAQLPAPGDAQPKFGKFGFSISRRVSVSNPDRKAAGKIGTAKPKNFIELATYEKRHNPAPGDAQPKSGFSTLSTSGGNFNLSRSKNYIDQHVHSKSHVPCPTSSQPLGGFSTMDNRGGQFNMSKSMGFIEHAIHEKKHNPGPGTHPIHERRKSVLKSANALYRQEMQKHQDRQKPREKLKAAIGAVHKMVKMGKLASLMQSDKGGGKGGLLGLAPVMHGDG